MSSSSKYEKRGVSSSKKEVHDAIKNLDKGLYPNAFCKILPDLAGSDPDFCNVMHADTAGTKTSLAYLYWKETGDLSVWPGVVQDAIVMNLDDLGCVGITNDIILSATIGRNKSVIPGEVIKSVIDGCSSFLSDLSDLGIQVSLAGGETADVGDVVRTIDIGYTAFARTTRKKIIRNSIQSGNVIVGLSSSGQASYEKKENSGIGSNGLTSARHDVLSNYYKENFPEAFDPLLPEDVVFTGSKRISDKDPVSGKGVGELLLSPTRTYLPFLKHLTGRHFADISGIIHCTGGAQTKVLKFIDEIKVIKDNLFEPPPVFQLIRRESDTPLKEMYKVFNMGHRLEIYTHKSAAEKIMDLASEFNIDARIIGRCTSNPLPEVEIHTPEGIFNYSE